MITTWYQPTCVVENVQLTVITTAGDAPEALELVAAQGVQPLVPRRVLDEPGLVAEPVVTVLPHAVEVCLVFSVVAVGELTIFIESASSDIRASPFSVSRGASPDSRPHYIWPMNKSATH